MDTPIETVETPPSPIPVGIPPAEAPSAPPVEPAVEPAAPIPPETPEQIQERKHRSAQRRIDEMTVRLRAVERDAEYWKGKATAPPTPEPTGALPTGEPQESQFETYGQYVKALARYEVQQERATEATRIATEKVNEATRVAAEKANEETQRVITAFEPQIAKARAKYDDFDEVVGAPLFGPMTQQMLLQSPQGAEIGYYLGKHPEEAAGLNRLQSVDLMRAIVKLEQRFEATPPKTISQATAPITPVGGAGAVTLDPTKMSAKDYYEAKQAGRLK